MFLSMLEASLHLLRSLYKLIKRNPFITISIKFLEQGLDSAHSWFTTVEKALGKFGDLAVAERSVPVFVKLVEDLLHLFNVGSIHCDILVPGWPQGHTMPRGKLGI